MSIFLNSGSNSVNSRFGRGWPGPHESLAPLLEEILATPQGKTSTGPKFNCSKNGEKSPVLTHYFVKGPFYQNKMPTFSLKKIIRTPGAQIFSGTKVNLSKTKNLQDLTHYFFQGTHFIIFNQTKYF